MRRVSWGQAHVLSYLMGKIVGMQSHSTSGMARPCWHCDSYGGLDITRCHVRCAREGRLQIQAAPRTRCAFWQRETGTDGNGSL